MTTVWQKARLFNPERGNAMAWIYTIARNIRFDALRKQQTQGVSISADDIWDVFSSEQTVSVEDYEEQSVFKNQMANYIAQLPKGQREVIEAVYVEGLTHQEFADMHELPLGTVKSRIRLALIKLSEWVN
jgi:RNA polymerase sigma-70 factor (ECF subfamily)